MTNDKFERGIHELRYVISSLRELGWYRDEEGEGTNALDDLCSELEARAAPTATATGEREIWEYSFIHSSALGRPDEKVTLLTYDKDTAFKPTCFDQKLVCSAGVAIAEVCQDADGFKHIAEIVEELDDIPAGTRLYAYSVAAQSPAPASPSGEDAAEEAAAPVAVSLTAPAGEVSPGTFEWYRGQAAALTTILDAFNSAWPSWYHGGVAGLPGLIQMLADEANAYRANGRNAAPLPRASEQADEAVTEFERLVVTALTWMLPRGDDYANSVKKDELRRLLTAYAARAKEPK